MSVRVRVPMRMRVWSRVHVRRMLIGDVVRVGVREPHIEDAFRPDAIPRVTLAHRPASRSRNMAFFGTVHSTEASSEKDWTGA